MPSGNPADAFRRWGYLQADLDPLGRLAPLDHPDLDAAGEGEEAERWRRIYCGPIGVEFMHMPDPERCRWVADRMESAASAPDRRRLLKRLAEVELFERFLHARYVGTKRYSIEGAAAVIPLLDAIVEGAAGKGAELVLIGMSHRGRLSVMHHIVDIPAADLFAGFEDIDPKSTLGSGDVKYHQGATGRHPSRSGEGISVHLISNPSHLEAVDPVVMGRARARQERFGRDGRSKVLPVTLHGDAAFAGQGIASETLNMADLPGFRVGGTVRVIVNNLIGFTTPPGSLHSSRFASDAAKRLPVPIFHVNGQDPEAVVRAGAMALDYRSAFGSDVVVDLVCYRRYGHSEVDDPTTTQPLLYGRIEKLPMLWQQYAAKSGVAEEEASSLERSIFDRLTAELERGRAMKTRPVLRRLPEYWDPYAGGKFDPSMTVDTAVDAGLLQRIARRLAEVPEGFRVHPKVGRGLEQRLEMARGSRPVDWGMAEALAVGSLLWEGTPVRMSGEDSRRGTFNHRHAVLFDTNDGREYLPLLNLREGQGRFDIVDTPLSEAAAVGFEYGFSRAYPDALVCWEAQFGDFANGAQVIIDQFLAAGEDKWGLLSGLVLLLPHGHEGQGAEHSSARLERFLDLCAEENMLVCQPSTAAQYFHLLRRQALWKWRKPLVVLTPKGMLRNPAACSPIERFSSGGFREVLAEPDETERGPVGSAIRRLLLCSGKIAHELRRELDKRKDPGTAVATIEQLYPFPEKSVAGLLERHAGVEQITWVQEEPGNMGALRFVRPLLQRLAGNRHVTTVKRSDSASPATGSPRAHGLEQQALIRLALARPAG